jgi:hypothetical protein
VTPAWRNWGIVGAIPWLEPNRLVAGLHSGTAESGRSPKLRVYIAAPIRGFGAIHEDQS